MQALVINLDRRPERLAALQRQLGQRWPDHWPEPLRVAAVDGSNVEVPPQWRASAGAWGCLCSHVNALQRAWLKGWQQVLILEDDAVLTEDFAVVAPAWLTNLPDNWQLAYLGGQHMQPPQLLISEGYEGCPGTVQPSEVRRTHAYAVQGQTTLRNLLGYLQTVRTLEADEALWHFADYSQLACYAPSYWLVGQASGASDISPVVHSDTRWWEVVV